MKTPKALSVSKPVKLIFAGGFLGSGKTTALAALARMLIRRGQRVGIITNDQSANLVDTVIVRQMLSDLGVPVEEVVEGCFCCKFDQLISQMEKILDHRPDVLMGEPVGSCTDFVAAVANPIKIHYQAVFRSRKAEIGHLKCAVTGAGRSLWANLTHMEAEPAVSDPGFGALSKATLMVNARVHLAPELLETAVRDSVAAVCRRFHARCEIEELQCFSPAYPDPPYLARENVPDPV
jgi:hypothetical protein